MVKRKRTDGTSSIPKSMRNSWRTPRRTFNRLDRIHHFKVDLAASENNALCPLYITEEQNALSSQCCWAKQFWKINQCSYEIVFGWANPPYNKLMAWFRKADHETSRGLPFGVVMLVPAFNGESRWRKHVFGKASEIYVFTDRLCFGHPVTGIEDQQASFGSMAIVWRPRLSPDEYVRTQLTVLM